MKLLLVDGYSLLFRAYFSSPPLSTREGQPTGALYGFIRMLLKLIEDTKPEYALVALDAHAPTFRHDKDETYKANRPDAPDDLRSQIKLSRELLDGFGIPHYEHAGFEADDILGTLSFLGAANDMDVTIVTGDGDALQLVSDKISVMLTRKGVSDLVCYTPPDVQERFSFAPPLVPDYKGLRGDTSDNIPGVPGIGEKTGIKLISTYGALENLYEKIEEVTPPRIRDLLKEHKESALHSREMARIVTDLPVEITLDAARLPELGEDWRQQSFDTSRRFEFKSLMTRFAAGATESTGELALAGENPTESVEPEVSRAATLAEMRAWLKGSPGDDATALLCHNGCLALARGNKALLFEGKIEDLKEWLEGDSPKAVFDAKTLKLEMCRHGIALQGVVADALLMGYLLDTTKQQHPITTQAQKHLNLTVPELNAPVEKKTTRKKTESLFEEGPSEEEQEAARQAEAAEKARHEDALARQTVALARLAPVLRAELKDYEEEKLFDLLELPIVDTLVSMEQLGMLLDPVALEKVGRELEAEANRLQGEIWVLAGEEFNVGSPKQLQTILFEKMGLASGRKTKTGHSTDVHTLEALAEENEIVQKILDYRAATKLKSTYTDTLLTGMDAKTHRIHTNLNQTGTVSGRISSVNPNLQNIPIRTEQGRNIRRTFISPPDQVLMKADYSQIELRILAHITGDEPLMEAFLEGADVHARTAADLFDVKVEEVDAEMRRKAKMTNYAIAYGVSGFGLAKQLGTGSTAEAQAFIKKYFETLPGVKKYIDDIIAEGRRNGYVKTLMGRRRPLPEINSPRAPERAGAERTAINHPVQGSAADIMKWAMLAVFDEMKKRQVKSRMIMQVHDELVFEVPHDEVADMAAMVKALMRDVPMEKMELKVPLEVDVSTGQNWNDTEYVV